MTSLKSVVRATIRAARHRAQSLAFRIDSALAGYAAHDAGKPRRLRMLVASDTFDEPSNTSEQQFAPFRRFRSELRQQLGLVIRYLPISTAVSMPVQQVGRYDLIGLKMSFQTPAAEALRITKLLKDAIAGSDCRLIIFDGDDDLNILWPDTLELADLYVKKHAYRDRCEYAVPRIGKSNLTDYVARNFGRSFAEDIIPASVPFDPALTAKLFVGWNIGVDDKIVGVAQRMSPSSSEGRRIDVASRAFAPPDLWIHPLRDPVARMLDAMSEEMRVSVPRNRVDQQEYYNEMLSATICVSPFGYGELCWRDFEAVLCSCLLVKPDMSHVETQPDIFIADQTYAPVRWDYSDLREVCQKYLADAKRRNSLIANADKTLRAAQTAEWFIGRVRSMLDAVKISIPAQ